MSFLNTIKLTLFNKDLSLDRRIFNSICLLLFLLSSFSVLQNIFFGLGILLTIVTIFTCMLTIFCYALASKTNKIQIPSLIILNVLGFILIPCLWYTNNGLNGPTLLYMPIYGCALVLLLNGLTRKLVIGLQLIMFYILLFLNFKNPAFITPYDNLLDRTVDNGFSFTITFIGSAAFMYFIFNEYTSIFAKNKILLNSLDEQNKILEKRNELLLSTQKKLEELSYTDSLTNVLNRRSLDKYLLEAINKATASGEELTIILFDIDHFKKVNDTFGHLYGDEVLIKVSKVIEKSVLKSHIFGRFGGEEFLAILPATTIHKAVGLSKIIQNNIKEIKWDKDVYITLSGGIAKYENGQSMTEFLNIVDRKLYDAKETGRNKFVYK